MSKRYPFVKNGVLRGSVKSKAVQNSVENIDARIDAHSDKTPLTQNPKIGGTPRGNRPACTRQVFSTEEVANEFLITLKKLKLDGVVYRCDICGMIHIEEMRQTS